MNKLRELEIQSHIDPEFQWILKEEWDLFMTKQENKRYRVYDLFCHLGGVVGRVIVEREGYLGNEKRTISDKLGGDIIWQYYRIIDKPAFEMNLIFILENCIPKVIEVALARTTIPDSFGSIDFWPELKSFDILKNT